MFSQNPQLTGSYGNLQAFTNDVRASTATINIWIDEKQFYVHRVELGIDNTKSVQGSSQQSATPSNISFKLDDITDLSNFNEIVTIISPPNASPFSAAPAEG